MARRSRTEDDPRGRSGRSHYHPVQRTSAVAADPDDNRILECAVDGKADIIVSNDHHLLGLRMYAAIPIVAGVDFRRTLGLK